MVLPLPLHMTVAYWWTADSAALPGCLVDVLLPTVSPKIQTDHSQDCTGSIQLPGRHHLRCPCQSVVHPEKFCIDHKINVEHVQRTCMKDACHCAKHLSARQLILQESCQTCVCVCVVVWSVEWNFKKAIYAHCIYIENVQFANVQ